MAARDGIVAAVDIGATKTLLTVRALDALDTGWTRGIGISRTESRRDPEAMIDWIVRVIEEARDGSGGVLIGVGVAAPGPLDAEAGIITRSSNLGWRDVPIAGLLATRLGAPTALEDDANSATLGEWGLGAGLAADPFVYLTVSSGIGSGIVVGGRLVRGSGGNAGEIGHIVVDATGPRCSCGRRGDIESYAGGTALARRARQVWPRRHLPDGRRAPRSAAEVFSLAALGDAAAATIVEEATEALATGFAVLAATLDPGRVAVGGSIGLAHPSLIRRATALARRRVMRENGRSLVVHPALLGEESVLAGAALLARRAGAGGRGGDEGHW